VIVAMVATEAAEVLDWTPVPDVRPPLLFTEAFNSMEAVRADALPETPRLEWHVPCTTLWWVDGQDYLGRIAIRHELNDFLLDVGGHIGYDVRPTRRREGHATAMLQHALPWALGLGIDPALVTCDDDNVGSVRVIEAAGGVLEDVRGVKRRYWVPTAS
jgi:predicted acetyltransferase